MARFYTDFSSLTAGTGTPDGFTLRWDTTNQTWTVVEDATATGGKYLRQTISSAARHALSWDAAGTPAQVEILVRLRTSVAGANRSRSLIRGGGTSGTENAYFVQFSAAGTDDGVSLAKYSSGAAASLGDDLTLDYSANTWYWIRIQANGTAIKAKYWAGSVDDEPAAWAYEVTDSALTSGWVGISGFGTGSNYDYDVLSVGTDGDVPLQPSAVAKVSADTLALTGSVVRALVSGRATAATLGITTEAQRIAGISRLAADTLAVTGATVTSLVLVAIKFASATLGITTNTDHFIGNLPNDIIIRAASISRRIRTWTSIGGEDSA